MPPAAGEKKTPGWTVKMALPTQATEPGQSGDAESLPKPELDFSRVPQTDSLDEIALRASMKGSSPFREKIRVAGFIVVLAAVGFGAYEKLAPFVSSMMKKTATAHIAEKVTSPKAAVTAKPANASAPSPVVAPAATPAITPTASPAPASSNATTGSAAPSDQKDTAEANSAVTPASNEKTPAAEAPKLRGEGKKPAGKERSAKKSVERESPAEAAPSDSVPADAPVIPAKLIRSATPVYPPDAMRGYITGDVKAELLVEANGSVGEVKVLSGPSALREAAVEALKKYEYAPATQGGKAVASKTTAVVKFWFNP